MYEKLFEKEYIITISPTSIGTYVAYDPIRKERLYKKKGSTDIMHFNSEKEAQEKSLKILKKKYPNHTFIF